MNTTAQKNELIFGYSSGNLGEAKSLFVSMYLFLNSLAAKNSSIFDNMLAENFANINEIAPKKLNYKDCLSGASKESSNNKITNNYNQQSFPLNAYPANNMLMIPIWVNMIL